MVEGSERSRRGGRAISFDDCFRVGLFFPHGNDLACAGVWKAARTQHVSFLFVFCIPLWQGVVAYISALLASSILYIACMDIMHLLTIMIPLLVVQTSAT